jgi:hypothetical protein
MARQFTSWPTPLALKLFRVAKFKQRRQLKSRPHLATLPYVQGGGCTGLSFCWIEQRLWYPRVPASVRLARFNTDEAWTRIDQLANRFNNSGLGRAARVDAVAPNIPGKARGAAIPIDGDGDFQELRQVLAAEPGYYVVELVFKAGRISHLCALYSGGMGLEFFDPNSGEYVLPKAAAAGFFRNLRAHYANYIGADGARTPQEFDTVWLFPIGV